MLPQRTTPRPPWTRRKLLVMATLAAMLAFLLPTALHLLPQEATTPQQRLALACLVVAMVLLLVALTLSWLVMALARSVKNL